MLVALSLDLCWLIVWLYNYKQYSISEVADLLVVCTKTVKWILGRYNWNGTVDPTEQTWTWANLDGFAEMSLVQSVMSKPNIYLDELQSDLYSSTDIAVSLSTICCTFQRLEFTRKKLQHVLLRYSKTERACRQQRGDDSIHASLQSWCHTEVFSQVKYFLKRNEVLYTSTSNPSLFLTMVFACVTRDDCLGYIHHAGYCI